MPRNWLTDRLGGAARRSIRLHVGRTKYKLFSLLASMFRNLMGKMVRTTAEFNPHQARFQLRKRTRTIDAIIGVLSKSCRSHRSVNPNHILQPVDT